MSKRLLLLMAAAALFAAAAYFYVEKGSSVSLQSDSPQVSAQKTVRIGGEEVRVDIADTPELRARGLSGRVGLESDEGMLFIFPEDGKESFWMKDMRFSIDILWLSAEGVVVDLRENVPPESFPSTFSPKTPARFVLELPAGFASAYKIGIGDPVEF